MGNHLSCTLSGTGIVRKHVRASRVIMPGGEMRQFLPPTQVAELMLEVPSFFVVNTKCLKIGLDFPALGADAELEVGNVYALFPMKRLNSKVTGGDMGTLLVAANEAAKRSSGGKVRVLPESQGSLDGGGDLDAGKVFDSKTHLNSEEMQDYCSPEIRHRISLSRSRKPVLETILEDSSICVQ